MPAERHGSGTTRPPELEAAGSGAILAREAPAVAASLRAQLRQAEDELEQLAAHLVETQDQLLAMYDLLHATRSHLGIGETLSHLAREATRLGNVQSSILCVGPIMVQHPAELVDERIVRACLNTPEPHRGDLLLSAPDPMLPEGITNLCLIPIALRRESTAALVLINREGGFSAPDLKLARAVAEQAGAYIEQALLYQESLAQAQLQAEMALARRVQLQLLPQARPNIPTLDLYAESRPALQVGGDFYDFVTVPERPLMLFLGDIAGKGLSAAMIMGLIRTAMRGAARFLPDPTPAAVLSRANDDIYDDLTLLDSFATTFVAQYLPEQGLIRYANAGHAPVIFRAPGGPVQLLEADGIPVGVLPTSLSEDFTLAFPAGALLVVTTDGFSEARAPDGAMFGYERLLQLVDEFADQPAQVIAYGLFNAIDGFTAGQPQEDDQTLIVIKGVN